MTVSPGCLCACQEEDEELLNQAGLAQGLPGRITQPQQVRHYGVVVLADRTPCLIRQKITSSNLHPLLGSLPQQLRLSFLHPCALCASYYAGWAASKPSVLTGSANLEQDGRLLIT